MFILLTLQSVPLRMNGLFEIGNAGFYVVSSSRAHISLGILFFLKLIDDVLDRHWTVFSGLSFTLSSPLILSLSHRMCLR